MHGTWRSCQNSLCVIPLQVLLGRQGLNATIGFRIWGRKGGFMNPPPPLFASGEFEGVSESSGVWESGDLGGGGKGSLNSQAICSTILGSCPAECCNCSPLSLSAGHLCRHTSPGPPAHGQCSGQGRADCYNSHPIHTCDVHIVLGFEGFGAECLGV